MIYCQKKSAKAIQVCRQLLAKKNSSSIIINTGGPLMQMNVDSVVPYWLLMGIVSYGHDECNGGDMPGVYTKVSSYLEWISGSMRDD